MMSESESAYGWNVLDSDPTYPELDQITGIDPYGEDNTVSGHENELWHTHLGIDSIMHNLYE